MAWLTAHRRRLARDERGSIMLLSSIVLLAVIVFAAATVNIAHQSETKRQLHTIADIAAQDAVYYLGTATAATDAQNAAVASAARNGFTVGGPNNNAVTATIGSWDAAAGSFTPNAATPATATAVKVVATTTFNNDILRGSFPLTATAILQASRPTGCISTCYWDMSGVQVGSFGARADVENAILGPALGLSGAETLSAASYTGLAGASISLSQLAAAANIASVSQLMSTGLTVPQILTAAAAAEDPSGSSSAAAAVALRQLSRDAVTTAVQNQTQIKMSSLVQIADSYASGTLSTGYGSAMAASTGVNLLNLVTAAPELGLMNSQHVVSATLPATFTIPNVANLAATLSFTAIEAPQVAYGVPADTSPPGAEAQTAQIRAQLTMTGNVSVVPLGALVPTVTSFSLPVVLEGFGGSGLLSGINCGTSEVDITAQPYAGKVGIGAVGSLTSPLSSSLGSANLISIAGVPVLSGSTLTAALQPGSTVMTFVTPPTAWSTTTAPPSRGPQTTSSLKVGSGLYDNLVGTGVVLNDAATTSGSPTLTSRTASFTSSDVGLAVSGIGILAGTTIASVRNASTVTLSNVAASTTSNDQVTINRATGSHLTYLGGLLSLSDLENSVLNPVLSHLDTYLGPIDAALDVAVAGLDVWNIARPGGSAGPECASSAVVN